MVSFTSSPGCVVIQREAFSGPPSSLMHRSNRESVTLSTGQPLLFESVALHYTHAQTVFTLSIVINRAKHERASATNK